MGSTLISGGLVITATEEVEADVLVVDEKIAAVATPELAEQWRPGAVSRAARRPCPLVTGGRWWCGWVLRGS